MILSTHGIVGSQITQFVGLLDLYPSAAAAYSLRKLRSAYTGSAIRVRRASDNTEQDIGFVGEDLNTSALTTFCSGTNGFVKTWYDQSGNGYDATQATAANQPQIVSSGSVITTNGKASLKFDGSNDNLLLSSTITLATSQEFSTFHIEKKFSEANIGLWMTGGGTASPYTPVNYGNGIYINSQISGSEARNSGLNRIGSRSAEFSGTDAQEFILYLTDQSLNRTGISSNINSFYSIY